MIKRLTSIVSYLLLLLTIFLATPDNSISQNTITFEEGLALPMSHQYTREAVHLDIVEWKLNHGKFETPAENNIAKITADGDTLRWQKVEIDDDGRFSGSDLRSGYLYLSFHADEEKVMWLNAAGHNMAYFNGVPRAGDIYAYGYMNLPVNVKEGKNEILLRSARWGGVQAKLVEPGFEIGFLDGDLTLPHILSGEEEPLWGALRIINSTDEYFEAAEITSNLNGREITLPVPSVAPMTVRKVPFQFDPSGAGINPESVNVELELFRNGRAIHNKTIEIDVIDPLYHYSRTFISEIDGSVQYYSVAPQKGGHQDGAALFLSVHGAEVEAISQARAYQPKDWGNLVAPTNRRPRGFNWEDWGRMDALEVLDIAKEKFNPDPQRIFLTGHSMGGHGTWYLGATYPDYWAAIAPAAGYPSLRAYGSHDGTVPDRDEQTPIEKMLLRSSNPADVMSLIPNYVAHAVYILHGDADRVVSVEHARTMRYELGKFHPDFAYYEYPGGSHWYGDESVDWPPLFQFFKEREIPEPNSPDEIRFKTANPGISHSFRWAAIEQQINPLEFSKFHLVRDKEDQTITGSTKNTARLAIDLSLFSIGDNIEIELDDAGPINHTVSQSQSISLARTDAGWEMAGELSADEKGPHRYGGFKETFTNRMVFVYGTSGTEQENKLNFHKARYDAETWYYRGNGAIDLIRDTDFYPADYQDRSVILFGNKDNNSVWNLLLENSPIQIERNRIVVGDQTYEGENLGAYFTYPRPDSNVAGVAIIAGTGAKGVKSITANQYFAGGSGYPDYMIFTSDMLINGADEILSIGFFDNDWSLNSDQGVLRSE